MTNFVQIYIWIFPKNRGPSDKILKDSSKSSSCLIEHIDAGTRDNLYYLKKIENNMRNMEDDIQINICSPIQNKKNSFFITWQHVITNQLSRQTFISIKICVPSPPLKGTSSLGLFYKDEFMSPMGPWVLAAPWCWLIDAGLRFSKFPWLSRDSFWCKKWSLLISVHVHLLNFSQCPSTNLAKSLYVRYVHLHKTERVWACIISKICC